MARNYYKELNDLGKVEKDHGFYSFNEYTILRDQIKSMEDTIRKKVDNLCARYGVLPSLYLYNKATNAILGGHFTKSEYFKKFEESLKGC